VKDVPYMTYENIFTLEEFPEALIVIGGGPIGAELVQAFKRLGSDVTSVDLKLMEREDDDVREVMEAQFAKDDIRFVSGFATKISKGGRGIVVEVTHPVTKNVEEATGTHLLVASGRRPKGIEDLCLDKAGVTTDRFGIPVDNKYKTSAKHIFAVGDCVSMGMQFTHLAGVAGGEAVTSALLGLGPNKREDFLIPRATFTHPEVATVGYTESQAVKKFGAKKVSILRKKLSEVDRAVCEGDTHGFIKIVYDDNRKVLGATIVAPVAGEMIAELGLAVSKGLLVKDLGNCINAYPTWSFALMQMGASVYTQDLAESSGFACLRRCCSRRLKGTPVKPSVEMSDLKPY